MKLIMEIVYEGVVEEVDGDKVLVLCDIGGRVVEQVFRSSQFFGNRSPEVGTCLRFSLEARENDLNVLEAIGSDFIPKKRKSISGIVEF